MHFVFDLQGEGNTQYIMGFQRHCFSFQIIMRAYQTLIKTFVLIVNDKQYQTFMFYTYFYYSCIIW